MRTMQVMFVRSESEEGSDGSSKYNDGEVSIVVGLVQQLLGAGLPREEKHSSTTYRGRRMTVGTTAAKDHGRVALSSTTRLRRIPSTCLLRIINSAG